MVDIYLGREDTEETPVEQQTDESRAGSASNVSEALGTILDLAHSQIMSLREGSSGGGVLTWTIMIGTSERCLQESALSLYMHVARMRSGLTFFVYDWHISMILMRPPQKLAHNMEAGDDRRASKEREQSSSGFTHQLA